MWGNIFGGEDNMWSVEKEKPSIIRRLFPKAEVDALKNQLSQLKNQLYMIDSQLKFEKIKTREIDYLRGQVGHLRGENRALKRDLENQIGRGNTSWIKQYLKFLIFACHPDRNNGKIEALEVTKILIGLR